MPAAIARGVEASVHLAYVGFLRPEEAARQVAANLVKAAFVDRNGSVGV